MAWKNWIDEAPERDGVFKCKMNDGTEKELILYIEPDWNELALKEVYWYHWFETEQDKKDWSPLDEEDEPEYWWDSDN